jgi:glycosyltransferase involved in cell wall biosynthesis
MPEFETLSIIVPVYNEAATIEESIRRALAVELPMDKEVIVIDDGSVDDTAKILKGLNDPRVKVIIEETNRGKGAAVRTGIKESSGDVIVIHDADLEYDPEDWPALLKPILVGQTEVSYGNRFAGPHRDMLFWHWVGNKFLSLVTNILFNTTLQDMETCYKAFTRRAINRIRLRSRRFEIEPEITAKLLKSGHRIYEVPISYAGREFHEGKKITWKDGFVALWTLIKYRVVD